MYLKQQIKGVVFDEKASERLVDAVIFISTEPYFERYVIKTEIVINPFQLPILISIVYMNDHVSAFKEYEKTIHEYERPFYFYTPATISKKQNHLG